MVRQSAIAGTMLLLASILQPCSAGQDSPSVKGSPEADLALTECGNESPPSLGGDSITIYCGSSQRPFIQPYLRVDWDRFSNDVTKTCNAVSGHTPITLRVPFELMSNRVLHEVRAQLAMDPNFRKGDGSVPTLFAHPYGAIMIFSGAGASRLVRYSYPYDGMRMAGTGKLAQVDVFPTTVQPFDITDSCAELGRIVSSKDLHGELYFQYFTLQKNVFNAHLSKFISSKDYTNLFNDQSQTGSVSVSTSGGGSGWGINLGGFSAGSSHNAQQQSTSDTRHRYMSASAMLSAARSYTSHFDSLAWNEVNTGSGDDREKTAQKLTDSLLADAKTVDVAIDNDHGTLTALSLAGMSQSLTPEQAKTLMSAVPQAGLSSSDDQNASASSGGATVSAGEKRTITVPGGPQMSFSKEGAVWIPTSITLYAVTQASEDVDSSVSSTEVQARAGDGFAMRPIQDIYASGTPADDTPPPFKDVFHPATTPLMPQPPYGVPSNTALCLGGYSVGLGIPPIPGNTAPITAYKVSGSADRDTRTLWLAPLVLPRCPIGTMATQPCVVPYGICVDRAQTRKCAVNDQWLNWYMARTMSLGMNPDIRDVCDLH